MKAADISFIDDYYTAATFEYKGYIIRPSNQAKQLWIIEGLEDAGLFTGRERAKGYVDTWIETTEAKSVKEKKENDRTGDDSRQVASGEAQAN